MINEVVEVRPLIAKMMADNSRWEILFLLVIGMIEFF
jgi:hypothetical protein